ncbi:hypothetical protein [Thiorhodococcus minor]|uniref:Uncharacterized protein n=1 Tax=Thiorhodococcus minor TaxID=57489 RepID=A0A6M0K8I4_9GAMM|nr:hypothetical protein [Thiorhodococcus minor]NEV65333.1 hypothetical protein [Thiorhodococcus minor]
MFTDLAASRGTDFGLMAPNGFILGANEGSMTGSIGSWRGPGIGRAGQGSRAGDIEVQVALRIGDGNPRRIETGGSAAWQGRVF